MLRHRRTPLLAASAILLACGGDPAPRHPKKPKKHDAEPALAEDRERRDKEDKQRELDREAEDERQERKERLRRRELEDQQQQQQPAAVAEDTSSSEPAPDADAEAKKAEADEARDKKKAAAEDAKAKKQAAAEEAREKKKAAAEEAKAKKQAAADEAKAKKQAAADEAKAKKTRKKKGKEDAGEAGADEDASAAAASSKKHADDEASDTEAAAEEAPKAKKGGDEEPPEDAAPKKKKVAKTAPKGKARKGKGAAKVDKDEIEIEDTSTVALRDPSHDSDELDLTTKASTPTEQEAAAPPPTLAIDRRPLTIAKGKLELHGGLRAAVLTLPNGMGGSTSSSSEGLALGATYGAGSKAEVGFDYTLGLHPGSLKGPLMLHGAYRVAEGDKLDISIAGGVVIDFVSATDPATMMTTTRTAKALQFGVWARYHLAAKLSVFSGLPALPSSTGNLAALAPLPPLPYQLSIGLGSREAIGLDLPVGLGYQATPKLYTFAVLDLTHIGMSNSNSAFLFADFVPLALGGFYAANKIDVGGVLSDDLKQGVDYLTFNVVVRYSLK